jgi:hypothetical protein
MARDRSAGGWSLLSRNSGQRLMCNTFLEGPTMYLVWLTLAISLGVIGAKTVKLYTNL